MDNLVVELTKPNGTKRYSFSVNIKENPITVFEQFELDLPFDINAKKLIVRNMNHFEYPKSKRLSYQDVKTAILNLVNDDYLKTLYTKHPDFLVIFKSKLTNNQTQKLFCKKRYGYSERNHFVYYYVKPNIDLHNDDPVDNTQTCSINDIDDFKTLQKKALLLEKENQQLIAGKDLIKDIAITASLTESELHDKLDTQTKRFANNKKKQEKLEQFLLDNYGSYLQTPNDRINFIASLVNNRNNNVVKALTNNNPQNLLALIMATTNLNI